MDTQPEALGGWILLVLLLLVPVWRIFKRAGFHPALSLLMFIPGVGVLITAALLAFRNWPAFAALAASAAPPAGSTGGAGT